MCRRLCLIAGLPRGKPAIKVLNPSHGQLMAAHSS